MRIKTITYKCDVCKKEFKEEAKESLSNATYTMTKYDWEGMEVIQQNLLEDVCLDCVKKISDTIKNKMLELAKGE